LALTKQSSFATFGGPHFLCLLAEAANRALKAVWYAKWFVHRTLRPEDFGGLVHMTRTSQASYPLHADVLNSQALQQTFLKYGSIFSRRLIQKAARSIRLTHRGMAPSQVLARRF
jgi:hypothetical protein